MKNRIFFKIIAVILIQIFLPLNLSWAEKNEFIQTPRPGNLSPRLIMHTPLLQKAYLKHPQPALPFNSTEEVDSLPEWLNIEGLAQIKDLKIERKISPVQKSPTENDEEFYEIKFNISYQDEQNRFRENGSIVFWVYERPEGARLFLNKTNAFNIRVTRFHPKLPRGKGKKRDVELKKSGLGISLLWLLMAHELNGQGKKAVIFNAESPSHKVFENLGDRWPSWGFIAKPLFAKGLKRNVEFSHRSFDAPALTRHQKKELKDFLENKISFVDENGEKIKVFPELDIKESDKYRELKKTVWISFLNKLYQTEELVPGAKLGELCADLEKDNGRFPTPIIVTRDPKTGMIIVLDGNHRLLASRQIDLKYIPMLVVPWDEFSVGVWDRGVEVINPRTMERLIKEFKLKPYDGKKDPNTAVIHYAGKSYVFDAAPDKLGQHKAAKNFIRRLDELDKDVNVDNVGKTAEEAEALIPVPGWLVIQLPAFTKEDIVAVMAKGEILPPKSFRTRLLRGPLGLPIRMEFLKNVQEKPELYIEGFDIGRTGARERVVEWINRRLQEEMEWVDFVELPQEMNVSETDKFRFPVKLAPVIKNHEAEFLILDKEGIYNLNPLNYQVEISRVLTPKLEFDGEALTLLTNFVAAADMIVAHGIDADISLHHQGRTLDFDEVRKRSRYELMLMRLYEGDEPVIINVKGPATLELETIFKIYEEIFSISVNTQDRRHPLFNLWREDKFAWIQESVKFLGNDFRDMTRRLRGIAGENKRISQLCSSPAFSAYKDRKLHRLRLLGAENIIEAVKRLPRKYSFILDEDPFLNDEQFWKDEEKARQVIDSAKDLNDTFRTSFGDVYEYLGELERHIPEIYDASVELFIRSNRLFDQYDTPAQYLFLGRAADLLYWTTKFMFKERIFSKYHLLDFARHGGMASGLNLGRDNPEALDEYLKKIGLNKGVKTIIVDAFGGGGAFLHYTVSLFESLGYEDIKGIDIAEDIVTGPCGSEDYSSPRAEAMSWLADSYNSGRTFGVAIENGQWTYKYDYDSSDALSLTINANGKYLAWLNRLTLYRYLIEREKAMRSLTQEMEQGEELRKPPVFDFEAFFVERAI